MKKSTLQKIIIVALYSVALLTATIILKDNIKVVEAEYVTGSRSESALFFSVFH